MTTKKQVDGRPQANTKKKAARYQKWLAQERATDEATARIPWGGSRKPYYLRMKWIVQERNINEIMDGVRE
jgi:hypothetical protein